MEQTTRLVLKVQQLQKLLVKLSLCRSPSTAGPRGPQKEANDGEKAGAMLAGEARPTGFVKQSATTQFIIAKQCATTEPELAESSGVCQEPMATMPP